MTYPRGYGRQALGRDLRRAFRDKNVAIIGLGESIDSGITVQDKGATAERNPFRVAVLPAGLLCIDYCST
jgi:hypothetical protein